MIEFGKVWPLRLIFTLSPDTQGGFAASDEPPLFCPGSGGIQFSLAVLRERGPAVRTVRLGALSFYAFRGVARPFAKNNDYHCEYQSDCVNEFYAVIPFMKALLCLTWASICCCWLCPQMPYFRPRRPGAISKSQLKDVLTCCGSTPAENAFDGAAKSQIKANRYFYEDRSSLKPRGET